MASWQNQLRITVSNVISIFHLTLFKVSKSREALDGVVYSNIYIYKLCTALHDELWNRSIYLNHICIQHNISVMLYNWYNWYGEAKKKFTEKISSSSSSYLTLSHPSLARLILYLYPIQAIFQKCLYNICNVALVGTFLFSYHSS